MFISIFFLSVYRLYTTRGVMTDLEYFYITQFYLALCPLSCPFLLYLAAIINCNFWVSLPEFIREGFHLLGRVS